MGQCRIFDADVTIRRYYGDYRSCDNTIPTSLVILSIFFSLTLICFFFLKVLAPL